MSSSFLSQEEIDSLLKGTGEDDKTELITEIEKDILGEIGNISMGSASTALYQLINRKVNITTPKVTITTLNNIKEGFDYPNIILDVEYISGIIGRNLLIMKTEDASIIANLMMGGDGKLSVIELSDIEVSAVQEAMNQMIGSAATSMATMFNREVNISPPKSKIWREINEKISDTIPEDEYIVEICFDLSIEGLLQSNLMQILPLETAKKIVSIMTGEESLILEENIVNNKEDSYNSKEKEFHEEKRNSSYDKSSKTSNNRDNIEQDIKEKNIEVHGVSFESLNQGKTGESHRNIDLILDVALDVSVVLGRTKKSIKDILNLSTGSLIELDKLAEEPVEILVNGKKIAYGEVVVVDENFGVRITSIVSGAERIKSLK